MPTRGSSGRSSKASKASKKSARKSTRSARSSASKTSKKTVRKTASKSTRKTQRTSASKSTRTTARKTASKPASKPTSKSTRKSGRSVSIRTSTVKAIREELLVRRAEIGQGVEHNLDHNNAPPLTRGDASDLAADALDNDTTLQLAERGSSEVAEIEQALRKIDEGTYGECETCGDQIPWSRLRALPYATMCVKCKERQERENAGAMAGAWSGVDEFDDSSDLS